MRRFLLILALSGCAAVRPLVNPVDAIIAEAIATARAPAAEQTAAVARAQQAGTASPTDRLRLATLLATLPNPHRDDARALELLEPIADTASSGIGRFAALLAAQVAERQRAARELERVSKDAERVARERKRVDEEREKETQALRQQLESLRAIERGILEREENLRRRQK
jgi:hypothetical protein